jgi:hypothetical protein
MEPKTGGEESSIQLPDFVCPFKWFSPENDRDHCSIVEYTIPGLSSFAAWDIQPYASGICSGLRERMRSITGSGVSGGQACDPEEALDERRVSGCAHHPVLLL